MNEHDHNTNYQPLIIILVFCVLLAFVQVREKGEFMYPFMGYFFIFFSLFKLFDLRGFVDGFSMYDLLTQRLRTYGYVYPFLELFLGLAYLTKFSLFFTKLLIFVISGVMKMLCFHIRSKSKARNLKQGDGPGGHSSHFNNTPKLFHV
jgi:hypothetical protein